MNILITSQKAEIAGSTYSVVYLAKGLAHRGHNVWVATPTDTLLWRLLSDSPVQLVEVSFAFKFHLPSVQKVKKLVQLHQINIVNAQSSKDRYSTILARWWYKLPIKLIHTRRQLVKSLGLFGQSTFYEQGTDAIVAVSKGVKQSAKNIGISEEHIKVIYNGTPAEKYQHIDPNKVNLLRQRYQIKDNDIVIGCVARHKEQIQLLRALTEIQHPVHVLFVGIEERPKFRAVQNRWPAPHRVHFAGSVDNREVLHHYPLFTMNVLPSTIEGLSQALLEAMALGVPVIATEIGGNSELIQDGVNGLLFQNGDANTLASHIQRLIDDEDLRENFSRTGKKTALEDFSIDKMLDHYEAFFTELLETKQHH
ncbi:MAG: glycosyltransferase family 4 protein [Bacteroidota bacterium]